jgi:choline dehydrogenase
MNRRRFLEAALAGVGVSSSGVLGHASGTSAQSQITEATSEPEYIVVGSGAGGGPLAANLARQGHSVVLMEAGLDDVYQNLDYKVPLLSAGSAPEEPRTSWQYFVNHYSDPKQQEKDEKMQYASDGSPLGIFYPRAATLGGCAAHNFLIAVTPHDSDWDYIAEITGDCSWSSSNMRKYWESVENNGYGPFMVSGPNHGRDGWLGTQVFDPSFILKHDPLVVRNLVAAALQFPGPSKECLLSALNGNFDALLSSNPRNPGLLVRDLNSGDTGRDNREGLFSVPYSTLNGRRSSPREFIVETVQQGYPLTVKTGALVTRVLFDHATGGEHAHRQHDKPKAIGVEYLERSHLYQADPNATPPDSSVVPQTARATREVILAGGAFNTPQLLKLSGIGPAAELRKLGIPVLIDLPGVGANLQDRYEVGIVSVADRDYSILKPCTFGATTDDPCLAQWNANQPVIYDAAGLMGVVVKRSSTAETDPDLFLYAAPYNFTGYYRGYSQPQNLAPDFKHFSWSVLKAHTRNIAGTVTLRSTNPLERPEINFHYFHEGTTINAADVADLDAVADAVEFVRKVIAKTDELMKPGSLTEIYPGPKVQTREQIKEFIRNEAWGHHASCTAKIGADDDSMAVLDSRFRVRGTRGLRVVDASVFPRIPGYFVVVPIYMMSEKAADVILEDGGHRFAAVRERSSNPGVTQL